MVMTHYRNTDGGKSSVFYRLADDIIWEDCLMSTPGQRIRAKRKELGYSQAHLASLAGIKQSSLSEIETGESKMPSAEALLGLSKALNISQAWIITGRDGEIELLSPDEEDHAKRMRALTAEQRRAVYALVESMGLEE
jgi:HTH-type transcriptional regulator, cell division transcriptional repressor